MPRPSGADPKGVGFGGRPGACDLWPGITTGFDARCTNCTWAEMGGVYQVKIRDYLCPNHGGPLESALARAARWQQGIN